MPVLSVVACGARPAADLPPFVTAMKSNKLACGTSDTLALGLLNEAIGRGLPIVPAPAVSDPLARHPAFRTNVETLRSWGIDILPGGPPFPWAGLTAALLARRPRE